MINETLDLEEAILGVLLTDSTYMEQLVLDEKYFQNPLSKKILELLKKQYSEYHTIDLTGLVSNYRSYFEGGNSISVDYLVEISIRGLPNQFEYYQDSLFRLFIRKLLLYEIQKFQSGKINQEELLDSIHELEQKTISKKSDSLTGDQIYNLITQKKQKIMFQYSKLTNAANIQENDLIVIAARPGIGKTGFALNLLNHLGETYKCLYFNMEMTEQQLYRRLVSINCKVPMMEHDSLQNSTESFLKKEQVMILVRKKLKL